MSKQIGLRLTIARKVVIVIAGAGVLASIPGIVGITDALAVQPQSPQAASRSAHATMPRFEVASVKPCKVEDDTGRGGKGGGAAESDGIPDGWTKNARPRLILSGTHILRTRRANHGASPRWAMPAQTNRDRSPVRDAMAAFPRSPTGSSVSRSREARLG
jgi:hypothetical protein